MKSAKRAKLDSVAQDRKGGRPQERSAQVDCARISTANDSAGHAIMPDSLISTLGDVSADTTIDAPATTEEIMDEASLENGVEAGAEAEGEGEAKADSEDEDKDETNAVDQAGEETEEEQVEAEAEDDDEWWNPPESDSDSDTGSDSSSSVTSSDDLKKENESDTGGESDKTEGRFVTEDGKYTGPMNLESLQPAENKAIDLRRYAMVNWQVECNEAREMARVLATES